jgi:hypothetical protein
MFLTKLKAAVVVLLVAGLGAAAVLAGAQPPAPAGSPPAPAAAAPPAVTPPPPKGEPTAARKLLDRLKELKPQGKSEALEDPGAAVLRDLIQLGPAAIPDVVAELDATTDPFMLRCLGFVARGIGDTRAVPALIRSLPKTCLPPASDYGLRSDDPQLLAFMQAHAHDKKFGGGTLYAFGRPQTEFRTALQTLTGKNHDEDELNFVHLGGSPRQRDLQRALFRRCAERWAAWWERNAKTLAPDPRYAKVGLPPAPRVVATVPVAAAFPHGPQAVVGEGSRGNLLESARARGAKHVVMDLDTGRGGALPEKLRPAPGQPERVDDIAAWAAGEGYDLMGTEYTPPGGGAPHYVIRGLGLTAWPIDAGKRGTLGDEITGGKPLDFGKPAAGLLARYDADTLAYRPEETGLFLFRTREGGFGWIFVGVEVHDDTLAAGVPVGGDPDLSPVSFWKGRRYGYGLVWDRAEEKEPADRK